MYEYDVFISYKRTSESRAWVHQYFVPKLTDVLAELLPTPPKIFLDERSIEPGDIWKTKIRQALQRSKCLVAVLNAPYFYSQYCMAEWRTFVAREDLLKVSGQLIKPIQFFDGEHFDQSARDRQIIDMRPWATSAPAFRETREFLKFEEEVKGFATKLAGADGPILKPVAYRDWPLLDPTGDVPPPPVPQPRLG